MPIVEELHPLVVASANPKLLDKERLSESFNCELINIDVSTPISLICYKLVELLPNTSCLM